MECVVIKPFLGDGVNWDRNQLVDADRFRNGQILIGQRYLRPATAAEIASAVEEEVEPAKPVASAKKKPKLTLKRRSH